MVERKKKIGVKLSKMLNELKLSEIGGLVWPKRAEDFFFAQA